MMYKYKSPHRLQAEKDLEVVFIEIRRHLRKTVRCSFPFSQRSSDIALLWHSKGTVPGFKSFQSLWTALHFCGTNGSENERSTCRSRSDWNMLSCKHDWLSLQLLQRRFLGLTANWSCEWLNCLMGKSSQLGAPGSSTPIILPPRHVSSRSVFSAFSSVFVQTRVLIMSSKRYKRCLVRRRNKFLTQITTASI